MRSFNVKDGSDSQCGRLLYDQACLSLRSGAAARADVYTQSQACHTCPLLRAARLSPQGNASLLLSTVDRLHYEARTGDGSVLCRCLLKLKEKGVYYMNIPNSNNETEDCCKLNVVEEPDEYLLPLLVGIVIALSLATCWYLVKAMHRRLSNTPIWVATFGSGDPGAELLGNPPSMAAHLSNTRLRSMDIFRGVTISLMILVNYGGGGYSFLGHSIWNGLTLADVVFPHFAFLMGMSLYLSLHTRLRTSMRRTTVFQQILRRSIILISLGIILSSKNRSIENLRLPGVLQRLGLSYLIIASVECFTMNFSNNYTSGASLFRDLHSTWRQWTFTLLLVAAHLGLTFGLPLPDCPRGYLGPGGLDQNATVSDCTGGAAGYIDRFILGGDHLHRGGTFRKMYNAKAAFDPEGLLGTLTCCLVVQLGVQAGRVLLSYSHARARLRRWLSWSLVTGLAAGGLCYFSKNDGPIPINKNLWSLSFCLATSSIAFFIQAVLYFAVDMHRLWGGRPFYYAGRNALLLYIGHDLMKNRFPFEWNLDNPTHAQYLAMNVFGVILWLIIAIYLHRKRIVLTI